MSNQITSLLGRTVGSWNGEDISELQNELNRIRREELASQPGDKLIVKGIPHRNQLPEDLHDFRAYPIWGCDVNENCLCGARANRIVTVADVRQYSLIDHH